MSSEHREAATSLLREAAERINATLPPLHFVVRAVDEQEIESLQRLKVDTDWCAFAEGDRAWALQTYLRLREVGIEATCGRQTLPGVVNVGHTVYLAELPPQRNHFVVACQADYRPCYWAQLHVVQNMIQDRRPVACWLPHWPQPGLAPRNADRNAVETVAFAGRSYYVVGGKARWLDAVSDLGLAFRTLGPRNWNDCSEIDVLLAIRSFDTNRYPRKPPSKLICAWLANVPLVAGNDSAFKQIGTPGEDYLVAASRQEAIDCITRLRDDSALYQRIVENGRRKAQRYCPRKVAEQWIVYLRDVAGPAYRRWTNSSQNAFLWQCRVTAGKCARTLRRTIKHVMGYKLRGARIRKV